LISSCLFIIASCEFYLSFSWSVPCRASARHQIDAPPALTAVSPPQVLSVDRPQAPRPLR
jgi:hypothetical protein